MKTITLFFLILICTACQTQTAPSQQDKVLADEIEQLATEESKSAYLEAIMNLDQKVRLDEDDVLEKYGHGSNEYKTHWELINQTDLLNLKKIEMYLAVHGHPKKEMQTPKARVTPYMVIHHQSTNEARKKNFHYLYNAYKTGDLKSGSFAFFLNRFYDMEFGHRLELKSPFREEFEIDTLMNALGLTNDQE